MPDKKCHYCHNPATKLCDGVLAFQQHPDDPTVTGLDLDHYTCDRPLCDDHVEQSNNVFYDWTDVNGRQGCVDTRDICPDCVRERHVRETMTGRMIGPMVTPEDGHAMQRRRQMRSVFRGAKPGQGNLFK